MGIALCKKGHLIHANGFYKNGTCKSCALERANLWKESNPDYGKRWVNRNPENTKKYWARRAERHQEKIEKSNTIKTEPSEKRKAQMRASGIKKDRRYRETLADVYVARLLGCTAGNVSVEVIGLKRQHILLKRELKKIKEALNGTD